MKILFLTDKFPPEPTTVGNLVFKLGIELKEKGHEVFVLTTVRSKEEEGENEENGIKVFRIYADYHERYRSYLSLYNPQTVKLVKSLIKEISPDVVHAHNIHQFLSYHSLKLAKHFKAKVFLTAHDVMSFHYAKLTEFIDEKNLACQTQFNYRVSVWQQLRRFKKRYNPFRNFLIRVYLNRYVDKVFAVSFALKEALNQNGIENVEVIHNGINSDSWVGNENKINEFKNKFNLKDKKMVLFGGRLSPEKGGQQAVLAMSQVVKEVPDAILLVMGVKNQYVVQMQKVALELGLEKNIVFTGQLGGGELVAAYYSSHLLLVPSICFDSFPTVILEAMSTHKPVVATCYGGGKEVIVDEKTGFVVNPFDVELVSQKIITLLRDPQKQKQMGESGFERMREFTQEKFISKLLEWYK